MTHVVIAARGGASTKTRLAPHLDATARHALTEAMLEAMLHALKPLKVSVVSPTSSLLCLAQSNGALAVQQTAGDLNDAFRLGAAGARRDEVVACLPGDLPLIDRDGLCGAAASAQAKGAAIVASHADGGTGALLMRRDLGLVSSFGPTSFARHVESARALGVRTPAYAAPSLGADIDTIEHLRELALRMEGLGLPSHIAARLALGAEVARGRPL